MEAPLARLIAQEIRIGGPIGLDRYMDLCLSHPLHGYYRTRDPLGVHGDFTTSPEISQTFGELIGIWIGATWRQAGGDPTAIRVVELGPGRGTLLVDAVRALGRIAAGARIELHLVETSPILRERQREALSRHDPPPVWHERIETLPAGPAMILANEFFDALPVRQYERTAQGWCERRVGLSPEGERFVLGLDPEPDPRISRQAEIGTVLTVPGVALDIVRRFSRSIVEHGGALLAIDYGHVRPGFGDTLQAVAGHLFTDPFETPGEADLTAHVDFAALAEAARLEGARDHGPVDQRDFLLALGLRQRTDRLKASATPDQAAALEAGFARLADPSRRGMGALFKALCIGHPRLEALPGFVDTAWRKETGHVD